MRVTQYYLSCLSQASYLTGDETTRRAAVVDRGEMCGSTSTAAAAGLQIEYVIETHVHADFLAGHLEPAALPGAAVIYGASWLRGRASRALTR